MHCKCQLYSNSYKYLNQNVDHLPSKSKSDYSNINHKAFLPQ